MTKPGQRITGKGGGIGSNQYARRGVSKAGVKRAASSIHGVESAGSPNPQFVAATSQAVKSIPPHIAAVLKSKGVKTIAAKDASDVLSAHYDMNDKPRGYWSGSLHEVGAAYIPHTKQAFVAEHEGPSTARTKTRDPAGVMRHEIGHAVDDNFLDHRISQRDDFRTAYRADLLAIMHGSGSKFEADGYSLNGEAGKMSYFIQPARNAVSGRFHASDAGYSEAFAEGFASLHGGGAMSAQEFSISFPNTVKKIKELTAEQKPRRGKR